ncbi:hypothetical protein AHAS_Ahas13G0298400 [Arachis hypogaea]
MPQWLLLPAVHRPPSEIDSASATTATTVVLLIMNEVLLIVELVFEFIYEYEYEHAVVFLTMNMLSCSTAIRHLVPNICQNEARYDPQSLQIRKALTQEQEEHATWKPLKWVYDKKRGWTNVTIPC